MKYKEKDLGDVLKGASSLSSMDFILGIPKDVKSLMQSQERQQQELEKERTMKSSVQDEDGTIQQQQVESQSQENINSLNITNNTIPTIPENDYQQQNSTNRQSDQTFSQIFTNNKQYYFNPPPRRPFSLNPKVPELDNTDRPKSHSTIIPMVAQQTQFIQMQDWNLQEDQLNHYEKDQQKQIQKQNMFHRKLQVLNELRYQSVLNDKQAKRNTIRELKNEQIEEITPQLTYSQFKEDYKSQKVAEIVDDIQNRNKSLKSKKNTSEQQTSNQTPSTITNQTHQFLREIRSDPVYPSPFTLSGDTHEPVIRRPRQKEYRQKIVDDKDRMKLHSYMYDKAQIEIDQEMQNGNQLNQQKQQQLQERQREMVNEGDVIKIPQMHNTEQQQYEQQQQQMIDDQNNLQQEAELQLQPGQTYRTITFASPRMHSVFRQMPRVEVKVSNIVTVTSPPQITHSPWNIIYDQQQGEEQDQVQKERTEQDQVDDEMKQKQVFLTQEQQQQQDQLILEQQQQQQQQLYDSTIQEQNNLDKDKMQVYNLDQGLSAIHQVVSPVTHAPIIATSQLTPAMIAQEKLIHTENWRQVKQDKIEPIEQTKEIISKDTFRDKNKDKNKDKTKKKDDEISQFEKQYKQYEYERRKSKTEQSLQETENERLERERIKEKKNYEQDQKIQQKIEKMNEQDKEQEQVLEEEQEDQLQTKRSNLFDQQLLNSDGTRYRITVPINRKAISIERPTTSDNLKEAFNLSQKKETPKTIQGRILADIQHNENILPPRDETMPKLIHFRLPEEYPRQYFEKRVEEEE
ncbi:MAG: hypothetical protein EZS28_026494 [Streblomastix strix]|uniref:Uncharacterized protein n=1 Tax=Streblomastix strix TaxID=222440 RepID=A0A5J4V5D2_9EUKA|nr:MAG: hypothetical protein EZS28_026494 [Streblomastix strix]